MQRALSLSKPADWLWTPSGSRTRAAKEALESYTRDIKTAKLVPLWPRIMFAAVITGLLVSAGETVFALFWGFIVFVLLSVPHMLVSLALHRGETIISRLHAGEFGWDFAWTHELVWEELRQALDAEDDEERFAQLVRKHEKAVARYLVGVWQLRLGLRKEPFDPRLTDELQKCAERLAARIRNTEQGTDA